MLRVRIFSARTAKAFLAVSLLSVLAPVCWTQDKAQAFPAGYTGETGTSTDLYIMMGSDFVRPGLLPKSNYNIGIGHTFGFLKKDPLGDELTFSYTYEDAGSAFWHSQYGSDTESFGVMRNFGIPKTKWLTGYTWIQVGVTTFSGNPRLENRFYDGESLGAVIHLSYHNSIWIQETFNKIVTTPWYTTTSVGYTVSW